MMTMAKYFGCVLDKDRAECSSGCDEQTLLLLCKFDAACDHVAESMSARDEGLVDDKAGRHSICRRHGSCDLPSQASP